MYKLFYANFTKERKVYISFFVIFFNEKQRYNFFRNNNALRPQNQCTFRFRQQLPAIIEGTKGRLGSKCFGHKLALEQYIGIVGCFFSLKYLCH